MAKKFIDAGLTDTPDSLAVQDGTALALTNVVRVLYDNTIPKHDLVVALDEVKHRIIRDLP